MPKPEGQALFTQTKLAEGLRELLRQIEERLSLSRPLTLYLAGGMAVHLYTASRVTTDVDAEFGSRVLIPNDLRVKVLLPVDLAVSKIAWLADNGRYSGIGTPWPDNSRRDRRACDKCIDRLYRR